MPLLKAKWKKVTSAPKGRLIVSGFLVFFIVIIAGGTWYWNANKKEIVKHELETTVQKKSNGLYKIKYDSLRMDEVAGNLSISNMNLSYDSTRYIEFKKQGNEPSMLLHIQIPEISVSGVKTPRALIENEIVGRKLEIKNPTIHIIYTNSGKDAAKSIPPKAVYEQLLGNLDLIKADTVLITGARIITSNRATKKTGINLENVFITLVDVKVDSASNADITRILFAKEASITCTKLGWSSGNNLYKYSADNISLSSVSRHLLIKNFRIIPQLNEEAFVIAYPVQVDRYDFSLRDIDLQNINLSQLLKENIVADNMFIPAASFKIYRDRFIPADKKSRVGHYPHQLMQNIPVRFRVKKVVITNGFIEYKERHHISRQAGKLQYYHVNASITNFTNDKKAIAANNIMTVDMSSHFLNKAPLKITGNFYLLHPKGRFDLKGSFGAIGAAYLNTVIEKTGLTHIKKGKINGAEFNFTGDDYTSDGTVKILYEDLKVAVLEKDKGSTELDNKALTSFLANISIRNSNPKRNEEPRVAQVHHERDINKSFFNFAWKTLLKGLMQTVGVKMKE